MKVTINELAKYKNWQYLKSTLLNTISINKDKGDIFELITKYYLLIDPIYQTKLKNIWLLNEVPDDIKKHLNLPDNDEGIDLIAKTKDDEYWAIQCKYRTDEDSSITRDDIATFLDVSNNICKNITHKLVCTTANRQSYKFDKYYDDNISFLLSNIWNNLDEEFFSQLTVLADSKTISLKPFQPKAHQQRAIVNANVHFKEEDNSHGKLIMACGSGKSLTAYWIAQELQVKTILIAVPSLALIKQTLEVWTRESIAHNIDINWLAVCSDDTVSELDDTFMTTTKELGIDVSTDIDYVSNWLQNKDHNITIVFTTYQSGKVISEASAKAGVTYDFGIMDEAHKTVGLKDSLFSHLLFDENISIKKRLFMTATERRYRGSSDDIASMDDIELYGEDFEVLTFKEALDTKPPILCDYKIVAMMVTKKEISELIENNNYIKLKNENYTKEIEAEMLASTVALHKAIKKHGIKHTISFHSSIERAKFFQTQEAVFRKSFSEYTDLDTFHVSGQTPTAKRNKVIDIFSKSENSLITNARCLTEGVDVPNIDCVLFADPRQSTVDIVQAVGRALRLAKDKEFGYVLVPILIDDENIDIDNIKNKSFQAVINILRALASSDDRIIDYFQTMNSATHSHGSGLIDFDIPMGINIDIEEFNNAIKLSIISKIKKLRWQSFEEAREFVRSLGLRSGDEWKLYCKNQIKDKELKPIDIPSTPNNIYKLTGWDGMKDWIGTKSDLKYLPFEEAREFARNLGLKTHLEWTRYCVGKMKKIGIKPDNIPRDPDLRYRKYWINIKDWLGTTSDLKYLPFEDAREFARSLGLKTQKDWQRYCVGKMKKIGVKPDNIPRDPDRRYGRDGWINYKDWLKKGLRPFDEAKEFVKTLNLKSSKEWNEYCKGNILNLTKKLDDIPRDPDLRYRKYWINWEDWLTGSTNKIQGEWRPFEEAKEFARSLGLNGQIEWRKYCKGELDGYEPKPDDIPVLPDNIYKNDGWIDSGDWLGTGRKRRSKNLEKDNTWLSYEKAKEFIHSLNLKDSDEWLKYIKGELEKLPAKPDNIPNSPIFVYRNSGWNGMNDWIGNDERKTKVKNALSFEEAREFVRKLGLKDYKEWNAYKKSELDGYESIPDNIQKTPNSYYKKEWKGMRDWLGTT